MKKLISIICLVLVVCLSVGTLSGCHKKNEIALVIGGVEIKTSTYLAALIEADLQARQDIYKLKSAEEDFDSSKEIDYSKETLDGKDYNTWVKDRAILLCQRYVYVDKITAEKKVAFSESEMENLEARAQNNWSSYGYAYLYTNNGVSYDTYLDFYRSCLLLDYYFLSIYGKDGTDAIPEVTVNEEFYNNYDIMHFIYSAKQDSAGKDKTAEVLKAEKEMFEQYAKDINSGKYTFKEVEALYKKYQEEQNKTDSSSSSGTSSTVTSSNVSSNVSSDNSSATTSGTTSSGTKEEYTEPKDSTATLIATEKTESNYATDHFDRIHALEIGKALFYEDESGNRYLFVRDDIKGDPYYLKANYDQVVYMLKYEDFSADIEAEAVKLSVEEDTWATGILDADEINYEEYNLFSQYYQSYGY